MSSTVEAPILQTRGLTKARHTTVALRDVDIEIAAGEVVGLLASWRFGRADL
ncbi:MAG TPA: hypothetical protein VHC43_03175 [Mycobacteriales bacterium]|nr:hypothetical protein [Mycobacteriales bacterium]